MRKLNFIDIRKVIFLLIINEISYAGFSQLSIRLFGQQAINFSTALETNLQQIFTISNRTSGYGIGIEYGFKKNANVIFGANLAFSNSVISFSYTDKGILPSQFNFSDFIANAKNIKSSLSFKYRLFSTKRNKFRCYGVLAGSRWELQKLFLDLDYNKIFRNEVPPNTFFLIITQEYFTKEETTYTLDSGLELNYFISKNYTAFTSLAFQTSFQTYAAILVNYKYSIQDQSILKSGKVLISSKGDGLYLRMGIQYTF